MTDPIHDLLKAAEEPAPLPEGLEDQIWSQVERTLRRASRFDQENDAGRHGQEVIGLPAEDHPWSGYHRSRVVLWAAVVLVIVGGAALLASLGNQTVAPADDCADYDTIQTDIDRLANELTANPFAAQSRLDRLTENYQTVLTNPELRDSTESRIRSSLDQIGNEIDDQRYEAALDYVFDLATLHQELGHDPPFASCDR